MNKLNKEYVFFMNDEYIFFTDDSGRRIVQKIEKIKFTETYDKDALDGKNNNETD